MNKKIKKYIIPIIILILLIAAIIIKFSFPQNNEINETTTMSITETENIQTQKDNFVSIIPIINI